MNTDRRVTGPLPLRRGTGHVAGAPTLALVALLLLVAAGAGAQTGGADAWRGDLESTLERAATTGRPVTHQTASVTVLTENAMLADAWATALLVLGRERGLEIANDRDMAVLFIERGPNAGDKGTVTTASERYKTLQA